MATLNLVKTEKGQYFLQGTGDPSRNADFSLFDWDGEGGDPFSLAPNQSWQIVSLPTLARTTYHCSECGEEAEGGSGDGDLLNCPAHPNAIIDSVVSSGVEYDADDTDTFWSAQAEIIAAAEKAGIEVPDYAKGE